MSEGKEIPGKPEFVASDEENDQQNCSAELKEELFTLKKELKKLQEKNALLQIHIDNTDDIMLVVSAQGKILKISHNWSKYLDYDLEYLKNLPDYSAIIHPEDRETAYRLIAETLTTGKKQRNFEYRVITQDGKVKWFCSNTTPIYNDQGKITAVAAFARDITELKQILQALEESKQQMREAQTIGKIGDWEWRADEDFVRWSDEMYRIFNVEPGTVISRKKADEIFPENERERVLGLTQKAIDTGAPQSVESKILRDNGEIGYIYGKGKAIRDEQGKLTRIIGFYQDITERKLYEEELKKSEARYRLLIENMQEGVVIVDNDDVIQYINKSCCDIFGYSPEFLTGKTGNEYLNFAEDRKLIQEKNLSRQQGMSDEYEVRGTRQDGSLIWLKISGTPLRDESGTVFGSMGIMTDITEKKRAEREKFRLLNLLDSSLNEIYMFDDQQFRISYANQGALRNTGYSLEELKGLNLFMIAREFSEYSFRNRIQPLQSGVRDNLVFETTHTRKDGRSYPVEAHLQLYRQEEGDLFLAVVNDITESRSLQEQLLASQKMEAIGRLAGGIAHDFNNLLTVILGYGEELLDNLPDDDPARFEAEEIVKAGQRASSLTHQLLAFSRRQVIQPRILDINSLLTNLGAMLHRLIGEHIEIETKLQPELWEIKADPGQIEQVIINMVVNSRDAMPNGGKLSIETSAATISDISLGQFIDAEPGNYVIIKINDCGEGIPKDILDRIFEPFFSTKDKSKGLGLGLSTAYGIVKQSGGFVTVESELGKGTCFRIYLPATREKPSARMTASVGNDLLGNGEKIMIVEDEVSLLQLFAKIVGNLGYNVTVCANGTEALELIHSGYHPDLVITDIIMPVLNGKELADRITILNPKQKLLYMSGFTDDVLAEHGVASQGIPFLQKPFTARGIAVKIKQLLEN